MAFLRLNGLRSIEFGTPGPMRDHLNDLIINANKRATAGLLMEDYIDEGEEIEFVGEQLAILDNQQKQIGIIKVTRVEVLEFKDVPTEFALAEAEGDLSGDDFRKSHFKFWSSVGIEVVPGTKVVTVYFDLEK
ncbi:MAG: ASCH domain-containing protein [Candidatus Nanopelagicus sp.]